MTPVSSMCVDTEGFVDSIEAACITNIEWDCTDSILYFDLWGYTHEEWTDIVRNCPVSCGLCEGENTKDPPIPTQYPTGDPPPLPFSPLFFHSPLPSCVCFFLPFPLSLPSLLLFWIRCGHRSSSIQIFPTQSVRTAVSHTAIEA
jgi:hypothetical protein